MLGVLVLVGVVPLASVGWKLIGLNREALTTSAQENQLLLATATAREVDIHVESVRSRVVSIANALGPVLSRGGAEADQELQTALDSDSGGGLWYLRFTALGEGMSASDRELVLPEPLARAINDGFDEALSTLEGNHHGPPSSSWMSDPVLIGGDDPQAELVVEAPVVAHGKLCGVLSAVVSFESIWTQIVGAMRTGETLFVIDGRGVPFASSRRADVAPGMNLAGSEIVQRFLSSGGRASETRPFDWTRGEVSERHLGSYGRTEQGWAIVIQAREEDVYAPVSSMIESTVSLVLAALALAALAAIVLARTLSTPINRLAAASRAFASGQFSSRVEIRSNNEIGELADTFNLMASEIETHIRDLKRAADENSELFLGTIRALANAIDAKDPYTRGHSVRVNRYAVIIARRMGLDAASIDSIHVASVLHDVGKIGIDDAILKKPGALTRDEFEVMKTHTTRGADIMAPIRQMERIIPGLRHHHERWNGTGYPDGLAGEGIPLMGRIIAVADTFDAMTTDRPYQRAFTFTEAVARINELKGLAFDERAVEAFNRAYVAGEFGSAPDLSAEHAAPTAVLAAG